MTLRVAFAIGIRLGVQYLVKFGGFLILMQYRVCVWWEQDSLKGLFK